MKRVCIISFCCIAVLLLMACAGKSEKGADSTKYESYQEACTANDFEAAYDIIEKQKGAFDKREDFKPWQKFDYEGAKFYVFEHEANYLMEQGNDQSTKRLLYLVKENEGSHSNSDGEWYSHFKKSIDKLMTLALMTDNSDFIVEMLKRYPRTHYFKNLTCGFDTYEYIAKLNQDKANKVLMDYLKAEISCYKSEEDFPVEGQVMKEEYVNSEDLHNSYVKQIEDYNELLNRLLDVCISTNNMSLANLIVSNIEPVPSRWAKGQRCRFSNKAKENAKSKIKSINM